VLLPLIATVNVNSEIGIGRRSEIGNLFHLRPGTATFGDETEMEIEIETAIGTAIEVVIFGIETGTKVDHAGCDDITFSSTPSPLLTAFVLLPGFRSFSSFGFLAVFV